MTAQQQDDRGDERSFPRMDTGELEEAGKTDQLKVVGFKPTHIRNTNPLEQQARDHADLGGVWGRTLSRGSRRDDPCK